jgi:hypothetical protein
LRHRLPYLVLRRLQQIKMNITDMAGVYTLLYCWQKQGMAHCTALTHLLLPAQLQVP